MLSITGMTLEQFADLMQGLGYRAEKGEREKVKPVDAVVAETGTPAEGQPVMDAAAAAENTPAAAPAGDGEVAAADVVPEAAAIEDAGVAPVAETAPEAEAAEAVSEVAENETPTGAAADAAVDAPEIEVFYTFTWGGRARQQGAGNRGQRRGQDARGGAGGKGKPRGAKGGPGKPGGKKGGRSQQGGKTYSARPPKKEKQIDPDNPFAAALMGLKQGD
jgi:ATP-dependent RNA helicase SUPV3L1/SUV3